MKFSLKTLSLLLCIAAGLGNIYAAHSLAIVKGSTIVNVYKGKGDSFPIVATIAKDEFFYCDSLQSEWVSVVVLKWSKGHQVKGYVHRTDIQLIDKLGLKQQQQIFIQVLRRQELLAGEFQVAYQRKDSAVYRKALASLEEHSDIKYSPVLGILPDYFCATKDIIVLKALFNTMLADHGSASEMPSYAVGWSFICQTELVSKALQALPQLQQKKLILDQIEFGVLNNVDHLSVPQLELLKKRIKDERLLSENTGN